ncbi:tyrosine-protein phosphatase [Muriicola marianensis]|uniref:protein-tyrosine-phosphatase n=1 Tax=Muriicola marianensis TaxID=1324801 RepID=A0ABQ1QQG9_9FLAO|nr:CpsB/CapC family capsule biosynthesis tyrosine phosphatase [Muriicola marianensis]GGD40863.1 capsular polysaccharide biosynthesis protein [Muriicola marianensis]
MFTFFQKKRFLVDALAGYVDIHNHILPGIDDGAKTVEDSLALMKEFDSLGIRHFIATPHIMAEYYPNTPETIRKSHEVLKAALVEQGMTEVSLLAAAEHMIDLNYELALEGREIMPIKNEYLLVEMSYLQPSLNFREAVIKSMRAGYHCILAHPERYAYLYHQKKKYNDYKALGIHFQLNLLSLGGYYGKPVEKMARELLHRNMVDFVASDAHKLKHLKALKEIKLDAGTYEKLTSAVRHTIRTFL